MTDESSAFQRSTTASLVREEAELRAAMFRNNRRGLTLLAIAFCLLLLSQLLDVILPGHGSIMFTVVLLVGCLCWTSTR